MMKIRLLYLIPAPLAALVIFISSNREIAEMPDLGFDAQDKLYHALGYFIFGVCLGMFFTGIRSDSPMRRTRLLTLLTGAIYAATDEIHQYFVPGRQCDIFDWVADLLGVAFALFILKFLQGIYAKFNK